MTDFRRFFESVPGCNLVVTRELVIVAASDEYLRATMTTRADIVGRGLFEVFPDDPNERAATGAATVRASFERVLRSRRPDTLPVQRYPIRRPESLGGEFEERYWSPLNRPILGEDGDVEYIVHHVEDVTEVVRLKREKLEQDRQLHEASSRSARYVELLDSAPDAIVIVGDDARIQLVNIQAEVMFGYARAELIGERLELLIPERFRPQHAGHMSRYFAAPASRPMGSALELFGRRKDGTELPIEVSLSPHVGAHGTSVSASIRDVSERKRFMDAARLTSDRLASAVESIQEAFAIFDAEDRLILCNSVYRRLVNDALPGPLVGMTYRELLEPWMSLVDFADEAERSRFRAERLGGRREPTAAFDVRLRDGRKLRITDRRTAEGGMVKTIWDLTEDERLSEELRQARAAAEAASAAKSEFLSSMSHELRTPLNAILGFAQLLQRDVREPLSPRHRPRVQQILQGGEHLLRLIDDVLDLARIEAGRVSIFVESVSVFDVLEEVRKTLEPIAGRNGIAFHIGSLPGALPHVLADRTRFSQILLNLGSNAIKYNRANGSVSLSVTRPTSSHVRVAVADTGMGIPADQQHRLFQPFQRAGQETGPIEGTGIGLVITQRLAHLMGGQVGFSSTPDVGSVFWVDMPVQVGAEAAEHPAPSVTPRPFARSPLGPRLILYVEDNAPNVVFMRDLIGTFDGTDLLTVPTAEQGLEVARSRRPELILMDINLPGMSGIDALAGLRSHPETKDIPVIALTAAATERDRQQGLQSGFYRYLTKPVNVDELIHTIESLLPPSSRVAEST